MTAVQEPDAPAQDDGVDRAQWLTLRRAARHGHLQPEGLAVLDEIHERHPQWREEWDL